MSDLYITIKWKKRGLVSSVFNRGLDPKLMKPSCPLFIVKGAGSRRGREYYQKKKKKKQQKAFYIFKMFKFCHTDGQALARCQMLEGYF